MDLAFTKTAPEMRGLRIYIAKSLVTGKGRKKQQRQQRGWGEVVGIPQLYCFFLIYRCQESIGKPITLPPFFIKSSYQPASLSQYTAFGQCVLLQRAISGALLAEAKSSAYVDLCVRALPNALVAVSD